MCSTIKPHLVERQACSSIVYSCTNGLLHSIMCVCLWSQQRSATMNTNHWKSLASATAAATQWQKPWNSSERSIQFRYIHIHTHTSLHRQADRQIEASTRAPRVHLPKLSLHTPSCSRFSCGLLSVVRERLSTSHWFYGHNCADVCRVHHGHSLRLFLVYQLT